MPTGIYPSPKGKITKPLTFPFPRGIRTSACEAIGPWLTIGDPLKDIILKKSKHKHCLSFGFRHLFVDFPFMATFLYVGIL